MEQQHFGPQVAREIDLRADLGRAEAALGERHARPPSLRSCADSARPSSIIRGWRTARAVSYSMSSAGGRPQSCFTISLAYWVLPKRMSSQVPTPPSSIDGAAGVLELNRHRRRGVHQADDAHHRRRDRCLRRASRCRG